MIRLGFTVIKSQIYQSKITNKFELNYSEFSLFKFNSKKYII